MRFYSLIILTAIFFWVLASIIVFGESAQAACDPFDRMAWACTKQNTVTKRAHTHQRTKRTKRTKHPRAMAVGYSSSSKLVRVTARDVGRNPTGRKYLWCQIYLNQALRKAGYKGTGSGKALSSLRLGRATSSPRPGDIAVRSRRCRGNGHSGIVVAVARGKVKVRGGNQCGRRGRRIVCDSWSSVRRYRYRRI